MSKFIPYPFFPDTMPVDISFVFESEKPAGKHGFLKVSGEDYVFEDGTKVKFWGTAFNGGANFPEFEYSEKIAKRLSMTGINLVRLHQMDAEWNTPNIFSFSKGRRLANTRSFDSESIKRLDYLIYCLKKEGIYCYMEMFTYRKFKSGDGVVNADKLFDAAKSYSIFNRRMIDLQKELADMLWNHENAYTGVKYKDEPAIVLAEITNENDLFVMKDPPQCVIEEPYIEEFRGLFKTWLEENGLSYDYENCDINCGTDSELIDFKIYLQRKYYSEMEEHLRKIGVKIPLTGTNWRSFPANVLTQTDLDYLDGHAYFYDWRWGEFEKHCENKSITQSDNSWLSPMLPNKVCGMPFILSEWDMPWPNAYRAESPIYCAAVSLLQGWSGCAIHTYAYTTLLHRDNILGKEVSSQKIGGTPYREGIFSTWNDPAKFGLFYHAALMMRRGDIKRAKKTHILKPIDLTEWNKSALGLSAEVSEVCTSFEKDLPENAILTDKPLAYPTDKEIVSDTGELYRNLKDEYGIINSPRTKCVYGFLGKNKLPELDGVKVDCTTDFAVIAISSLCDAEITKSDNMLLTAVGRAENTGAEFDGDRLLSYGKPPVLIEAIEAEIEIKTEKRGLKVWAVSAEGLYIGKVPSTYESGVFKFSIGKESLSMYYLIVEE